MSILEIILIALGASCVILYATLKSIQVIKFRKQVKLGIEHGLTEKEARKNAYESVYNKAPNSNTAPNVNDNDETWED